MAGFWSSNTRAAHLAEGSDTAEKQTIGALWHRKSDGQGLFIVVEKDVDGKDMRQQLEDFLRASDLPRTLGFPLVIEDCHSG